MIFLSRKSPICAGCGRAARTGPRYREIATAQARQPGRGVTARLRAGRGEGDAHAGGVDDARAERVEPPPDIANSAGQAYAPRGSRLAW